MRIFLGIDQDGMFDTSSIAGWAFHQGNNDYMFNHHWDFWRAVFPGNWDGFGLALSFSNFGVEGLNLNLAIPTGGLGWPQSTAAQVTDFDTLEEIVAGFRFHGTYAIPGAGLLQFTYNAPGGRGNDDITWENATDGGQLGLSFLLNGLGFGNILFGGALIAHNDDANRNAEVHLGVALDIPAATLSDVMGLRFRLGMRLPGETTDGNTFIEDDGLSSGRLIGNIMPIFALGGGSLMVDFSLTAVMGEDDFDSEKHLGWSLAPVYRLPLAAGSFSIGVHLWNSVAMGGNQTNLAVSDHLNLNIPMLLSFNF